MASEKRLIDANALKERAIRVSTVKEHCYFKAVGTREIDKAPTVDAVEVVHGRWMPGYPISCSVCGGAAATDYEDANKYEAWITPYCPNCGAKMDGERKDNA